MDWEEFFHPTVKIHLLAGGRLPELGSEGANAYDVFARVIQDDERRDPQNSNIRLPLWELTKRDSGYPLKSGESVLVGVGFVLEMPRYVGAFLLARSGHTTKIRRVIHVINSPSLGDSDFRGELGVHVENVSPEVLYITPGMKIAQIAFLPTFTPAFVEVGTLAELSPTRRGGRGLGSTGE